MSDSEGGSNSIKSNTIPGPLQRDQAIIDMMNADESDASLMKLEELDTIIRQRDPNFDSFLSEISDNIRSDGANIEMLSEDELLDEGLGAWNHTNSWRAKLLLHFPRIIHLLRFKLKLMQRLKNDIAILKLFFIKIKEIWLPTLKLRIKDSVLQSIHSLKSNLGKFKYLSLKKKALILAFAISPLVLSILFYKVYTTGIIEPQEEMFINSMESWSQKVYFYDKDKDPMEGFYQSSHTAQNVIYISKLMANIRKSKNSSDNPMVAFELYLDGTTPEVIAEIKSREHEVRDRFLRVVEGLNYKQMDSQEGKRLLCDLIRKEANSFLTTGKLRKVLIKTFVIKP